MECWLRLRPRGGGAGNILLLTNAGISPELRQAQGLTLVIQTALCNRENAIERPAVQNNCGEFGNDTNLDVTKSASTAWLSARAAATPWRTLPKDPLPKRRQSLIETC